MSMVLLSPGGRVDLSLQMYTFGSASDNQFVLNDGNVSPRHTALQFQGQGYAIVDLGSASGTYLNEQRLLPEMPVTLQKGDRFRIGDVLYTYETDVSSQPEVSADPLAVAQSSSPAYLPVAQEPLPFAGSGEQPPLYLPASQTPLPGYGQMSSPAYPSVSQASLAGYGPGAQPAAFSAIYGQSNPGYPPPGQVFDPYAGQVPYTPQPGMPYPHFPPAQHRRGPSKALILLLVLVLILGSAVTGLIIYLNRPQPIITVTSAYKSGPLSIGASSTSFEIVGHKFSGTSVVTFLLDGSPAPGSQAAYSDSKGDLTVVLKIADAWPIGNHVLTARDASGYATATGVNIKIVTPGQSHTPGPNGAPSDDASGTIDIAISTSSGGIGTITLTVTGGADGGTVCRAEADGQSHTTTGTSQGVAYTETMSATCNGTYKGGKINYVETVTDHRIVFENGLSCTVQVPYVDARLDGQFTSATSVNGSYAGDPITITCNMGVGTDTTEADQGSWTGVASMH